MAWGDTGADGWAWKSRCLDQKSLKSSWSFSIGVCAMFDLDATIRERRSVRGFLTDRLVPGETIDEVLDLAQRAPSNCNIQPWRVFLASGARCQKLREALVAAFTGGEAPDYEDPIDDFSSEPYRALQIDCAVALYRDMGIARNDRPGRLRALGRNFELFDAPHVAVVCMDKRFGVGVALDVGMYVQTLMLALWSRGVASCAQASLRTYPAVLRRELGIREELRILCGISFGYEDPQVPANHCRQKRNPWTSNVVRCGE
jgi:nitroreductase